MVASMAENVDELGIPDSLPDLQSITSSNGDPDCVQCEGKGRIGCPVCGEKGFYSMEMMGQVSSCQCRMCNGRKFIPCPTCKRLIYKSIVWWDVSLPTRGKVLAARDRLQTSALETSTLHSYIIVSFFHYARLSMVYFCSVDVERGESEGGGRLGRRRR